MGNDRLGREYFEELFSAGEDPWDYGNAYETAKYDQTLSLLPADGPVGRALEVGCAEGVFTRRLAERAETLVAVDISETALERARRRCADLGHVRFQALDLFADELPGGFDLAVCSELLYFAGSEGVLARTAGKLAGALRPGGLLLTAHANVTADSPDEPGFGWNVPFGARRIGQVLVATGTLGLERELDSGLYRVQRWRRLAEGERAPVPAVERVAHGALTDDLARYLHRPEA